jgi:hypothetical protein
LGRPQTPTSCCLKVAVSQMCQQSSSAVMFFIAQIFPCPMEVRTGTGLSFSRARQPRGSTVGRRHLLMLCRSTRPHCPSGRCSVFDSVQWGFQAGVDHRTASCDGHCASRNARESQVPNASSGVPNAFPCSSIVANHTVMSISYIYMPI